MSEAKRFDFAIKMDEAGLTIEILELPDQVQPTIDVVVPPQVPLDHVYVYRRQRKSQRRQPRTIQQMNQLLLWLGSRQDGECRQTVLGAHAVVEGLVPNRRKFGRLVTYAVEEGYLVRHRLGISHTGGAPTCLLDWAVRGESVYQRLADSQPHPTFYRQAIKRYRSANRVYLALETRAWLLRTGYVAAMSDIDMFPKRRQIESGTNVGEMLTVHPGIVITRPDGSCLVIKLDIFSYRPTPDWYNRWHKLGHLSVEVGVVTVTARRMDRIVTAIARWRVRDPDVPRGTRFLFTNLQTLVQRSQPGAEDPLPPGEFWLAELPPV